MRRTLHFLAAVVLLASFAWPVPATVRRDLLAITSLTTGANTAFTASTTIYSRRLTIQADRDNTATVYIGNSSMDPTSATTLSNTCYVELAPGASWTLQPSELLAYQGEEYQLSRFRASGTTGEKVRMAYEVQETP